MGTTLLEQEACGSWLIANAANGAPAQLLEKIGFTLERQAAVAGLDTLFYEMRR
jgi:hypothetical protein